MVQRRCSLQYLKPLEENWNFITYTLLFFTSYHSTMRRCHYLLQPSNPTCGPIMDPTSTTKLYDSIRYCLLAGGFLLFFSSLQWSNVLTEISWKEMELDNIKGLKEWRRIKFSADPFGRPPHYITLQSLSLECLQQGIPFNWGDYNQNSWFEII